MDKNTAEAELNCGEVARRVHKLPRFAIVFYAITALCAVLYVAFFFSKSFSDFFNRYISSVIRAALAHLTGWIPFSLAEYLIILLPLILVVLASFGMRRYADTWRGVFVFCGAVLSVAGLIFSIFTLGFAPAYRGSTLDERLGLERTEVSAEELYETALILAEAASEEYKEVKFSSSTHFSVMPYNYSKMNDLLIEAYGKVCDEYTFIARLDSNIKPIMLSEPMSYTHITGVYTFFTGEANLNVAFPDHTLPYTAAHELSHQRGIAREDEANFMAFIVCTASDDAYIRYCGYVNLYDYVASALYSASPELYAKVRDTLPSEIKAEQRAYSEFFDKYRDSVASDVSETVNNAYLTLHGTEGTKSYGMVVDLAVAYYRSDK